MKIDNIDNNNISPLASKKADSAYRAERPQAGNHAAKAEGKRDKAELSENARLMAKARAALEKSPELENERLAEIRNQINNGDYTIQVNTIVQRLMAGIFSKR